MASDIDKPLVSVIVPVYNVGMFALPCVNSLLGQTYSNIEYIIVDDGCTDNTIDLIEDAVGSDTRFKICIRRTAVFLLRVTLVLKGATVIMSCMLMGTI